MRWPRQWSDASLLEMLRGTPVSFLLVEDAPTADRLRTAAESLRLPVTIAGAPPSGVEMVQGDWPGTKAMAPGENEHMAAGPTGEPWIDSNGWKVKLAEALHPGSEVWVEAAPTEPRLLVAGTNPVNTDAVCMALMGYDPMAVRGTPPFETCDSTLALAEAAGIGTRDLRRIEVAGGPIREPAFDFAALRRQRRNASAKA